MSKRVQMRYPISLLERLDELCEKRSQTRTGFVLEVVRQTLEKLEKEAKL